MALNSLLFYQFFVYISPKIVGGHNWDFATFTPQLHGILVRLLHTAALFLTVFPEFVISYEVRYFEVSLVTKFLSS